MRPQESTKRSRITFAGITFSAPTSEAEAYLPGNGPRKFYTVPVNILRKIIATGNANITFENTHADGGPRVATPVELEQELQRGERPYACYISSEDPNRVRYCTCLSINYNVTERKEQSSVKVE